MESIVKIGTVEMHEHEAAAAYAAGKLLVTYKAVHQIHHNHARGWYGVQVYSSAVPLVKRGRHHLMTGDEIDALVGSSL